MSRGRKRPQLPQLPCSQNDTVFVTFGAPRDASSQLLLIHCSGGGSDGARTLPKASQLFHKLLVRQLSHTRQVALHCGALGVADRPLKRRQNSDAQHSSAGLCCMDVYMLAIEGRLAAVLSFDAYYPLYRDGEPHPMIPSRRVRVH